MDQLCMKAQEVTKKLEKTKQIQLLLLGERRNTAVQQYRVHIHVSLWSAFVF